MSAIVAARPDRVFPDFFGETKLTIEAPCGYGFIDVLAQTVAPKDEVEAAIIEVKTRDEYASAGDVIRQLKWYKQRLPLALCVNPVRLIVVVEDADAIHAPMLDLLAHEGIEVLPISYFQEAA